MCFFALKWKQLASKTLCFFNKLDEGQNPKEEDNFSHTLLSLLFTHANLAIQALFWL
jgi:hypothetical protein